ncbi:MAG: hypothetical protein PQJ59_00480 [Spirochaetales bacterium]|nr:hypothetical protein [Spirochaetales bacterium]
MKFLLSLLAVLFILSCGGSPMSDSFSSNKDLTPPVLLDYSVISASEVRFSFDEAVSVDEETMSLDPAGEMTVVADEAGGLVVSFPTPRTAGSQSTLYLDVSDGEGNTNWFLLEFYAPNGNQPGLVINEVSPNGTSSRPDMVEFYVRSGGNTAGLALVLGTEDNRKGEYDFPEMELAEGEYIIFHCRPEGEEGEISETGDDLSLSTGTRSEEGVRDLWPDEDMNLSGTSGILTLLSLPQNGVCLDRLIYTNRTCDPDDSYVGWTSTIWPRIEELSLMGEEERGWFMEGEVIFPDECVWSDDTTSTRTLCRSSLSEDSDSAGDWHTAPTGGCSFGYPNGDECYEP